MNKSQRLPDSGVAGHGELDRTSERPRELEDWLNFHLYHPLSSRLARCLVSSRVTPNMVSVAGGVCVIAAAIAYTTPGGLWPVIIGFVCHIAWHVMDGADGDLARLTGKAGLMGEVVDGLSDYLSHLVLYCALASTLSHQIGAPLAWFLAIGAGMSRILQANFYEVQRRQYQWWVYGRPWLGEARMDKLNVYSGSLSTLAHAYLFLGRVTGGMSASLQQYHVSVDGPASERQRFEQAVVRHFSGLLRPLGLLGANQRTITLGASMLVGSPIFFFVYEVVLLNIALILSRRAHVAAARDVAKDMARN